jgi:transposase
MLAHLLVSKYCDHLPFYRQSEIYARDGRDLDRSTLSDWVGQAVWLLQPILDGIRNHVSAAERKSAPTTRRSRCWSPASAAPGPGDYGCSPR